MGLFSKIACFQRKLDNYIFTYLTPDTKVSLWRIRGKMVFAKKICGINYPDFYQYRCENASLCEITRKVLFQEQKTFWHQINPVESRTIVHDKYKAYLHFKDFYRRDVVFVSGRESKDEFVAFCQAHPLFIVKPLASCCGRGIQLIDSNETAFSIDEFIKSYSDGFVAEELINQDESLSQLHQQSVNTLRINTVNYGTSIEVIWPCLRIGCGESIVDNAAAGGVFGAIDSVNGRIMSVSDEFHHTFSEHPDTKIPLIGFTVPKWQEACEMAKQLAALVPDLHFVGWDLALTDKGWVMVEGNHQPYIIWQIATGKGIRNEFLKMKKRLLRK